MEEVIIPWIFSRGMVGVRSFEVRDFRLIFE